MTATLADPVAEPVARVLAAAQNLLAKRTGAPVSLIDPVDLGGSGDSLVLRVRVTDSPFSLPRTLVVKQVQGRSATVDGAFTREAVSYQFANALPADLRPGPHLIAHDLDERLLVLSDLGDAPAMGKLLASKDQDEVAHSLMALAQALGRMHAATFGREDDFAALLRRAGGVEGPAPVAEQLAEARDAVPAMLSTRLGISVDADIVEAVAEAEDLFSAGGYRAFSPADLCPDNVLVNGDGVKFLDYEWGGFRDATLDISYALVSFPTCLCTVVLEEDQVRAMLDAWRAEVVGVWPALDDDHTLYSRVLLAQLGWVWLSTYLYLSGDEAVVASAWDHQLAVPPSEALAGRWRVLADFATRAGCDSVARLAAEVLDALAERS